MSYFCLVPWPKRGENDGLDKPEFRQDSDFKVTIWRKQADQKTDEVGQKTDEVIEKMPQVSQKKDEVSRKIEQLSQKAQQLSQKMSQKTFESILYAINNGASSFPDTRLLVPLM